jgi:hypothetical protein
VTIKKFYAILNENGFDPNLVRINDNTADCVYFINKNYYKYEVGFRERGNVFQPKTFYTESEALRYVLKEILSVKSVKETLSGVSRRTIKSQDQNR